MFRRKEIAIAVVLMATVILVCFSAGRALAVDEHTLSWDAVTQNTAGETIIPSGYRITALDVLDGGDPIVTDVGNVTTVPLSELGLTSNKEYSITAVAYINETQAGIVREVAKSDSSESINWWYDLIPTLLKQVQNLIISPPASSGP